MRHAEYVSSTQHHISFAVVIAELVVLKAHPQQSAASIASTRHHPLEVHVTLH
jgi:hypothetical protein